MASERPPSGCLSIVLKIFGIDLHPGDIGAQFLPYRLRDDFLSPSERSFFGVLVNTIGDRAQVFTKVRVADLLYVPRGNGSLAYQNRISSKHVDFLLCDRDSLLPLAAIELDDASHGRADRVERDEFLDEAFRAAELPLLRFRAQRQYDVQDVAKQLSPFLDSSNRLSRAEVQVEDDRKPLCPKCGSDMVLRTAAKGNNRGEQFYGCCNYPQCRGIVPAR